MDLFPLTLFPEGSLASSVITTVWIGVTVVAFFNLRFGWVLSGLVVPGYIVPLLLVKPMAAAVVFTEAVVTYFTVWGISEFLSRLGYWSSLFGRNRFFALVLISIMVRVLFDGWILPEFGQWLHDAHGLVFDYRNNLHSFGLIIIALIANQFWKTGFFRGLMPFVVTVGITLLLVRFGLMTLTNFNISNLSYVYEDIAASILASPKAYIVLLTAAFVASRMNLLYGWDFSGILIPSLLALQWYQPHKIVLSFLEALVILWIAGWLMQTRLFRNLNIEGARKLLLFFHIGYLYKFLLGYLVIHFFSEVKVTDTYAFGYMLATLMAIKMHDKDIAARLTRATLQTSLVGVAVASAVGFCLTLIPLERLWIWTAPPETVHGQQVTRVEEVGLKEKIREDQKIVLYRAQRQGQFTVPLTTELETFERGLSELQQYVTSRSTTRLNDAARYFSQLGYEILELQGRYLYLREAEQIRGWGIFIFDMIPESGLTVEVPAPMDERGTLEAAVVLFMSSRARALAIAGTSRKLNPDGSADVLLNRQTIFHVFHRTLARRDVLQVRGYTWDSARVLAGVRRGPLEIDVPKLANKLWVHAKLPSGLDLAKLKHLIEELDIEWTALPFSNRQRETTRRGFAELVLNQHALRRVRARSVSTGLEPQLQVYEQRIDGFLQDWLLSGKHEIAQRGTDLYEPPTLDELLYFDQEILTPMLTAARTQYRNGDWKQDGLDELRSIQQAAFNSGYQLIRYRHRGSQQDYLILTKNQLTQPRRYWGTYVFRLGPANGYAVQLPRPLYEINSFEYSVALFERLRARALLIAGADPRANLDGSADIVRLENMQSLFSLVNQVVLRETGDEPMLVIHSRARGYRDDSLQSSADVILAAIGDELQEPRAVPLISNLLALLEDDGLVYRFVDGSAETAGYEVGGVPQSMYIFAGRNKGFCVLWLSPQARAGYRQRTEDRQEAVHFASLGIETLQTDLASYIAKLETTATSKAVPEQLRKAIARYLRLEDVVTLRRLQREWTHHRWQRVIDRDSKQSFLLVFDDEHRLQLAVNLNPRHFDSLLATEVSKPNLAQLDRFVASRIAWLEFGGEL